MSQNFTESSDFQNDYVSNIKMSYFYLITAVSFHALFTRAYESLSDDWLKHILFP